MSFLKQHTPTQLLKDGSSLQEKPVFKNISALQQLKSSISSCYGPNGLSKLVINALKKRIVTKDCSTILQEIEIDHPAVSLLKDASLQQLAETGDGSAAVILIAGELARRAEKMLREKGIPLGDILSGFSKSFLIAQHIIKNEIQLLKNDNQGEADTSSKIIVGNVHDVLNVQNKALITALLRTTLESKLFSVMQASEISYLSEISYDACMNVIHHKTDSQSIRSLHFDVDHIRLLQLPGGNPRDTGLVHGFVLNQCVENGTEKRILNAKIVVYNCAFDIMTTETKGTVLFETDKEMINYSRNEEEKIDDLVKYLKQKLGVNVIVSNASFGETSLHFIRKHGMMAVKVSSKHDIRRLCTAVGARCCTRISRSLSYEDIGFCDVVEEMNEMTIAESHSRTGNSRVVPLASPILAFRATESSGSSDLEEGIKHDSKISTIVIRGSTQPMQGYIRHALNSSINIFRLLLLKDAEVRLCASSKTIDHAQMGGFLIAGGGAFEAELAVRMLKTLKANEDSDTLLTQNKISISPIEATVIEEYADALYVLPAALAENSGGKSLSAIVELKKAHSSLDTTCKCQSQSRIASQEKDVFSLRGDGERSRCLCSSKSKKSTSNKTVLCPCGSDCKCGATGSLIGIDITTSSIGHMLNDSSSSKFGSGQVVEPLIVKVSALQLASSTIIDILSVDQMIMSKRAGGPKMQRPLGEDE